jgi:hypothetical protein
MPCRVREDPPATGIDVKQPATQTENLRLGPVEVGDLDVQVKLLWVRGVRPPRRAVILDTLERQHQARVDVKGREGAVDRPTRIRLIDHTAKKRLVELRKLQHIRTVKDHALQLAEHPPSLHGHDQRLGAASRSSVAHSQFGSISTK